MERERRREDRMDFASMAFISSHGNEHHGRRWRRKPISALDRANGGSRVVLAAAVVVLAVGYGNALVNPMAKVNATGELRCTDSKQFET